MCGCRLEAPCWGPDLQPRHVPWLGMEPTTLWFTGLRSIHWATPATELHQAVYVHLLQFLFVSIIYIFFIFFPSVFYNFLSTGFLHRWLNLFLGILFYFIFDAIINRIVFLVFLSGSSLLVHENATDFWILILYPATLLNSLISFSSFWWSL